MQAEKPSRATKRSRRTQPVPEFPGCRPIEIRRDRIATYEGRFEFWDSDAETAWVIRDPTGFAHKGPSQRLTGLVQLIAAVRGDPIECGAAMSFLLPGEQGEPLRIMQADKAVYLNPGRSRMPDETGMVIGVHDHPDVVLEVDHTTDVRRGKLGLYEEWGFPEVWVEVPERWSPSRPAGRRPGLTIYRLEDGTYRTAPESRAFAAWTAAEIHAAMNEPELSAATSDALTRVGRALGARGRAHSDSTPPLHDERPDERAARAGARTATLAAVADTILASRGIPGLASPLIAEELAGITDEQVVEALLRCADESDLRARLQALRRRPGPCPESRA